MRRNIKKFIEYHKRDDWAAYITKNMGAAPLDIWNREMHVKTKLGEIIAVWQSEHQYGYIEECRSPERLAA